MSESKHTPGPWRLIGPDDFGDYTIQPPNAELAIAAVVNGPMANITGTADQHTANARLIAAAPDLLEALKDARTQLEEYEVERTGETYNSPAINAAIAKAEGRS